MQDKQSEKWLKRFKKVVGSIHALQKDEFSLFCTEQKEKYGLALQKCVIKLKGLIRQYSKCSHVIFSKEKISELIAKCPLEWAINTIRENYTLAVDSLEDVLNPPPSVSRLGQLFAQQSARQHQYKNREQQESSIALDKEELQPQGGSLFNPPDQNNSCQSLPGFNQSSECIEDKKKKSSSLQNLPEKQPEAIKYEEGARIPPPGVYVRIKCCPKIQDKTLDDDGTSQNPELGEVSINVPSLSHED